ncbi:MAG: hypothetical protein AUJ49_00660 [Desulfovibrionaceae bacterium CG1_02_65_16]|nr:MAG: hypothetical protein AUJ49_00660 [Desulfovibrionaceae bacterium CG1_02_65_16]
MDKPHERRQFGRLHLLAYGRGKTCTLALGGVVCQADLIDVSAGGARLRHYPPPSLPAQRELVFSVPQLDDGGLLQGLAATVRWRNGDELGIQFEKNLDVGISALQRLIC